MNRSQPLLPIRFYSDLHDQDRFNILSKKVWGSHLVYPPNELPSFQITMPQSLATPSAFIMKRLCNEDARFGKLVTEQASNFGEPGATDFFGVIKANTYFDNGVDPPEGRTNVTIAEYSCGKLQGIAIPYQVTVSPYSGNPLKVSTPLTNYYTLKIVIDKMKPSGGSSFTIKVWNGTTLLDQIIKPGVYNYTFLSNGSDTWAELDLYKDGDEFSISYFQCVVELNNQLFLTDVQLDHTDLNLINTTEHKDIISWCDNEQNYLVEPGDYYYFIQMSDGTYLYSEVFTVKSYKEIEKYYRLTWWNSTDINGQVIYSENTLACGFKNKLFLDASLFQPEYETTVENIKDGENTDIPIFKKWQKSISLQIVKAPEFLADSLSAVFLHDNIFLRNPLNWNQEQQPEEYEILKVISEISPVLNDVYQKVELKLLLEDNYTKANCEEAVTAIACTDFYQYKAAASSGSADYYLTITGPPTAGDGLYRHSDSELIEPLPTDIIYDLDNSRYITLEFTGGIWQVTKVLPTINTATILNDDIIIAGIAIPNTFIKVQYNKDAAGWVDSLRFPVDEDGNFEVIIPESLSTGATDFKVRVVNASRNCAFATSSSVDVI